MNSTSIQLLFLGTGTSTGVPVIGCRCGTCTSSNPKNKRTRCGLFLRLPDGNLLIDTPTDLRSQLLREGIDAVHAVLFTHEHADHLFGLDDLRVFPFYIGHPVPLFCEAEVEGRIRKVFDYAFSGRETHPGGLPQITFQRITTEPFEVLGTRVVPIRLQHGRFRILGFRLGDVAYCTDTNGIPDESRPLLEGLDVLILDALRPAPHPTHFSLDEAIEVARQVKAKRTIFTHVGHQIEHEETNARLPAGMEMAYDGLTINN